MAQKVKDAQKMINEGEEKVEKRKKGKKKSKRPSSAGVT